MVEVLLHAAARAATFLIFSSHADCFRGKQHIKKSRKSFQPYTAHTSCDSVPDSTVDRCHRFNLMWLRELCLTGLRPGELMGLISILCSHTSCYKTALSDHDSLSTLCSHTDCDSNNAQRPHFVYNIALCALPFLML